MHATRLEKYRRRLYSRIPLLGGWLRRRAARALAEDSSPAAVEALAWAVVRSRDEQVRGIALETLHRIANPAAVDAFCFVWAATHNPTLTALLLQYRWVAQAPVEVRVLSALQTQQPNLLTELGPEEVEPLIQACDHRDAVIAQQAALALRQLRQVETQEAVCQHVILTGHPAASAAALERNYLPRDDHQRALFLFLTEQWQRYEVLDFDHTLLQTAYEVADPALRRRLTEKLRAAGRTAYLTVLAGRDYRSRAALLSPDEADSLVHALAANREWDKLWVLVFELGLRWSTEIVRTLARNGWQPPKEDERVIFSQLTDLSAAECVLSIEEITRELPAALPRARARVSGRVNDVAFSPLRPLIAIGSGRRKVVLWNFQQGEREQVLDGFKHSVSRVAFSCDDTLLCAERPGGSGACELHGWRDGRRFAMPLSGAVTAIESVGDSRVILTQRDGKVLLLDTGPARSLQERQFSFWARAARISPDSRQAALLHRGVTLVSLPELDILAGRREGLGGRVLLCAAFAPEEEALIVGQFGGEVLLCRRDGEQLRSEKKALCKHPDRVQGVEVLGRSAVIVTASADGTVRFTSWANRALVGQIKVAGTRLTSLHVSPGGEFVAIGDSDASMSLWDLRVLDMPLLLSRPFARTVPAQLAVVSALADDTKLTAPLRQALKFSECVLRYRFRYDIEIGDVPTIRAGEFDIEIEG
jgi:HEAT repeat protein